MKGPSLEKAPQDYQDAVFEGQIAAIDMIEAYKENAPTISKDKATIEHAIWLKVDPKTRKVIMDYDGYEAKWLAYVLADGGPCSPFKARARALKEIRNGFNVDLAWKALDSGVRTEHVYESFSAASSAAKRASSGDTLQTFERVLAEMLGRPPRDRHAKTVDDSPKAPKVAPNSRGARVSLRGRPLTRAADELNSESKILWHTFSKLLDEEIPPYVAKRLAGLTDASIIEEIANEFKLEVNACFQNMVRKVRNVRSKGNSKEILIVKQSKVIEASEILGLKVPARGSKHYRGWRPDLVLAKKAYFKLSARFHPDTNPNDPRCVERFQAIQSAWNILKEIESP
jgi:hypothetical protein